MPIVGHAKANHDGDGAVYGIFGSSLLDKAGKAEYQVKSQQFCLPTSDPAHDDSNESTPLGLYDATTPCNLQFKICLLYTSPSPRDRQKSRMPSSA